MRARSTPFLAVLSGLLLAGCAGDGDPGGGGKAEASEVRVIMSDFQFALDTGMVVPGSVTFRVENAGNVVHEVAVFRTDLEASDIPVDGDRIVESVPGLEEIGEVDAEPGHANVVTMDLSPGRYMLICNVPGHFQNGMWSVLEVV